MQVEGVGPGQGRPDPPDRVVDLRRGHRRVARSGIHVAPALDPVAARDTHQDAPLHGGDAVDAMHRLAQRHLHDEGLDADDAHAEENPPGTVRRQGV